jgi:hypothetical protein
MKLRTLISARRRRLAGVCAVLLVAGLLQFSGVNPASSQSAELIAYAAGSDPGLDPASEVWDSARAVEVPLTAQAGMYFAGGRVRTVSARALHHNGRLFVRTEWTDNTADDTSTRVEDFSDAVAVEFPAQSAASVPAVCMGQADGGVNIWQWRADSDTGVGAPSEVYANTLVDGYPSDEAVFYTARAAGNPVANNAETGPVQTLVAQLFGTLSPASSQNVQGKGVHNDGRWAVVFSREFESADQEQAAFGVDTTTDIAFAVWDGSNDERNGRKSVSGFVKLFVSPEAVQTPTSLPLPVFVAVLLGAVGALTWLGIAYAKENRRQKGTASE